MDFILGCHFQSTGKKTISDEDSYNNLLIIHPQILYNLADKKVCSYENEASIYRKALYIILEGFRGAFAWEFASDTRNHEMLNALSSILLPYSDI